MPELAGAAVESSTLDREERGYRRHADSRACKKRAIIQRACNPFRLDAVSTATRRAGTCTPAFRRTIQARAGPAARRSPDRRGRHALPI